MKLSAISTRLLIILFTILSTSSQAQNRPNILIIIADDMGIDAFSPYQLGTDLPNTPNLNALAGHGLLFNNAWAYATCAPSRASLITGSYGE